MPELAAHYLRYWSADNSGQWRLADNAPTEFWRFVAQLPADIDRQMIREALRLTAAGKTPETASPEAAYTWFANHPDKFDVIRSTYKSYKRKPVDIATVYEKAYTDVVYEAITRVYHFLDAEIKKY